MVKAKIVKTAPYVLLAVTALALPYLALQAYNHTLTSTYFSLATIEVDGFVFVDAEQALAEAGLVQENNIFTIDLERVEALLASRPFIRSAKVERRLPDQMVVSVEEYEPAAILVDEFFWLVDRQGTPFLSLDVQVWSQHFSDLPLISGISVSELEEANGQEKIFEVLDVARLYEELGLARRQPLSQIHFDPLMGVSLVTEETGTEIRLGWGRWEDRLERFKIVQSSLIERGIDADYILIDQEEDLSRIAVGQRLDPGTDR